MISKEVPINESTWRRFFGVAADAQSYMNILYLGLSFPLGIAYFVFLVTGISLGFGLIIIWIGIPILMLVLAGSWVLCELERLLANGLLREIIPAVRRRSISGPVADVQGLSAGERLFIGTWRRFKIHVSDRLTWTGILYLTIKFPLGIASFVIGVTLIAVTGALLTAPFFYTRADMNWSVWTIDTLWEAMILSLIGIPMVFITLHAMNLAALASGRVARIMLGKLL